MVAERLGFIRIYNVETMMPMYTLMCTDIAKDSPRLSILSFDWNQTNPEIVIATTSTEIIIWNTSNSWFVNFLGII